MRRRLLRSLVRNRDSLESATLALALPFVAGMVNAEGFAMVGVYTSHVTGTVAHAGDHLARGRLAGAVAALTMVAAFWVGAAAATALVEMARRRQKARYSFALGGQVVALASIAALGLLDSGDRRFETVKTLLLCFSMGSQNALVTKLSGAIVRNTHLTGVVTDLGIETVRVLLWHRQAPRQPGIPALTFWKSLPHAPELKRIRLHGAIFGSFFLGAILGPLLYWREGYVAMLLPIAVLIALIVFDAAIGLRSDSLPPAGPAPPRPPT